MKHKGGEGASVRSGRISNPLRNSKIVKCEGNCENLFSKIAEPPPIFCKDTIKPRAKTNLFVLCRGGVSKTKSKIGIKLRQKQILFAFCRSGTESKIRKAERKREFVHSFPGRILSSTKIDAGLHVKISGPKSYPSPSKYNPRQNKIGLFDRGVISRCAA